MDAWSFGISRQYSERLMVDVLRGLRCIDKALERFMPHLSEHWPFGVIQFSSIQFRFSECPV
jgi:hypothetical protein